jgi:hypothetical protein
MQSTDRDLARIFQAMKARYRTQALQNLGFYLMHTRPLLFYILVLFFLYGGDRWLSASKLSITHQVHLDAVSVAIRRKKELLF